MASPFSDTTYLWIVWQRGPKNNVVQNILGIYKSKGDAIHEAQRIDADGLTPIKDKVHAQFFTLGMPHLVERCLRGVTVAAK